MKRTRPAVAAWVQGMLTGALCAASTGCTSPPAAEVQPRQSQDAAALQDSGVPSIHDASADAAVALEHLQLKVGDFTFDALAAGPATGELVLLLHGFPETSYQWRSQLSALGRAGYRAVAPDQRGYSPGARPKGVENYAIALLVADVLGMADALGYDRFHVVGHDWGGGVAWGVAGVFPGRVRTVTVLSTPHPAALQKALEDHTSCQYAASSYFDALSRPDSGLGDLTSIGVGFDGVPDDATKEYLDKVITQPDVLDAALSWYRANAAGRVLSGAVGAITVPTLYLWGTADPTFCRETAEASASYVDGPYRFVPVEDAGHWLSETRPVVVNQELLAQLAR